MIILSINRLLCYVVIFIKYRSVINNNVEEGFISVRHSPAFIDKTLLIKRIFKHDFLYISAPSKFGKSTNLQMIKLFLGNSKEKNTVARHFRNTSIWENRYFVVKHMCNYPIIYCDFKQQGAVKSHKDVARELQISIKNCFLEHEYLLNSSKINKDYKKQFEKYCNLQEKEFEIGLNFLARLLCHHYKKRVFVLIDDFNSFILESIFKEELNPKKISELLFCILDNTINLNKFVERAVIMSSVPFELGTYFLGPHLLETFKFMESKDFAPFFGFTQAETEFLLNAFNSSAALTQVTLWYGGYSYLHSDFQVYNPWSVLSFIKTKTLDMYWVPKTTRKLLYQHLEPHYLMREIVGKLIHHENVIINRIESLTSYEVQELKGFKTDSSTVTDNANEYDLIIQFLLESGYLTFAQNYSKMQNCTVVKFPNMEVQKVFELIWEHLTACYYNSYDP